MVALFVNASGLFCVAGCEKFERYGAFDCSGCL